MKNILVAGGAGFIGSHLCRTLLEQNSQNKVLCLDNFYSGSKRNVEPLLENRRFKVLEHDVIKPFQIEEPFDEIYNLACPASPVAYQKNPVYTTKTSVLGILNLLELARETGVKILQASTSEVYGEPQVHPQTEDYRGNVNPIGIRSCYDEGKRCAESLLFDYKRMYGTEIKVMRIFNTYGPQMAEGDGRVMSNFIMQALRGEPLTIYGDGTQTRSFCYVDDLVRGMIMLMAAGPEATGPINFGNPEEITIRCLAEKVIAAAGSKSQIVFKTLPLDDPERRKPDISLARQKLGWQPEITLEEGLGRTIAYFK
ncbi:MAG: SDR family oxidoreductase [Acidaminococcaceae bacterium]|nr:SDR family oxidoreductase [Acidaminococcaceae bacterium]